VKKIITLFANKYGLTNTEVMVEIETVFSTMLSHWYRLEVMVFFRDDFQLEAVAYNNSGGVMMQKPVNLTEMKGRNTIKRNLEIHLAKVAILKQTTRYKPFERELLWGEITACDPEHNLYIEIEVLQGERVTTICPLNRIGLHERQTDNFLLGRKRAFHLRRVEPVFLNGTPRLKIIVDRVSKKLVETLLRSYLRTEVKNVEFRCVKRYVGHKSIVLTTKPLPKAAIISVDRELKERVQVRIVKSLPRR
jgi:hypothetical protein